MTKPYVLAASNEKIATNGAYLMDNGDYIYLYLGS